MAFRSQARSAVVCLLALCLPALGSGAQQTDSLINYRDLTLLDQDGHSTSLRALEGRTMVLHFMFTRCVAACHTQVRSLRTVRDSLPADTRSRVQFVSVSLDPQNDTPETLRRYADANGVTGADWRFVTASAEVVDRLTNAMALKRRPGVDGQIDHALVVFLFDKGGNLMQRYASTSVDSTRLVNEIGMVVGLGSRASQ
jgi:protein SCO1